MKTQRRNLKPRTWFVGVDWATEEHAVCLMDDAGKVAGERKFPHSGSGIAEVCSWLLEKAKTNDAKMLRVAIEIPRGAVVETMLERGMVVHSINPKQLDRFRDRFGVAGAKDDRRDARVLADSLRTDPSCFRELRVDHPKVIELREWSRMAEELSEERVRLTNRLRQQLLRYYPQFLELVVDIDDDWILKLWELIPTPEHATRARENTVAKVLAETHVRRVDAAHVLATLRKKPLYVTSGTTEAAKNHIHALIERIRLTNRQLKNAHDNLDRLMDELAEDNSEPGRKGEQRDVNILRSLPGVGRIVLATLLTEASQPLAARDYQALRKLCGVAPVTRASGKRSGPRATVVMRKACSVRLRNALYYWTLSTLKLDAKSRAAYAALRARGKTHGRALRTIGDRLIGVMCAMLRDGSLFNAPATPEASNRQIVP